MVEKEIDDCPQESSEERKRRENRDRIAAEKGERSGPWITKKSRKREAPGIQVLSKRESVVVAKANVSQRQRYPKNS
ncbi:MAG TPA: hypothetical protein VF189_04805 [Patescibacteria group bacterium]